MRNILMNVTGIPLYPFSGISLTMVVSKATFGSKMPSSSSSLKIIVRAYLKPKVRLKMPSQPFLLQKIRSMPMPWQQKHPNRQQHSPDCSMKMDSSTITPLLPPSRLSLTKKTYWHKHEAVPQQTSLMSINHLVEAGNYAEIKLQTDFFLRNSLMRCQRERIIGKVIYPIVPNKSIYNYFSRERHLFFPFV